MTRPALYQHNPRSVDIVTLDQLESLLTKKQDSLRGWHFQSLDITDYEPQLLDRNQRGAVFLGCTASQDFIQKVTSNGALVFPKIQDAPFDQYRGGLYNYKELYDQFPYENSYDANVYAWSQTIAKDSSDQDASLATALHDHAMAEALADYTQSRAAKIVGVMGGHNIERGTDEYAEAAKLGKKLTQAGYIVATGGGPGAMEAANLGALYTHQDLEPALEKLAKAPTFKVGIDPWAKVAYEVAEDVKKPGESLGIPTWFYGHEPPNLFATKIAKFFDNSIREATLLDDSKAGIIFLQGAAGTVQEIFQDACENYYASEEAVSPMVLVGKKYWGEDYPAWPLLEALAKDRAMENHIYLVDTMDEAVERIEQ